MTDRELIRRAEEMRPRAWAPYSRFRVGAALLAADGTVYTGCNIENAAYGPSVCAERVAFFTALADGKRDFVKLAVVGGPEGAVYPFTKPCGVCRQVMREFCGDDFVILSWDGTRIRQNTLAELLPEAFSPKNLEG